MSLVLHCMINLCIALSFGSMLSERESSLSSREEEEEYIISPHKLNL